MHTPVSVSARMQAVRQAKQDIESAPGLPLRNIFSPEKVSLAFTESGLEYRDRIFSPSGNAVCLPFSVSQQERDLSGSSGSGVGRASSPGRTEVFPEYLQLRSGTSTVTGRGDPATDLPGRLRSAPDLSEQRNLGLAWQAGKNDGWDDTLSRRCSCQSRSLSHSRQTEKGSGISNLASLCLDQLGHRMCV